MCEKLGGDRISGQGRAGLGPVCLSHFTSVSHLNELWILWTEPQLLTGWLDSGQANLSKLIGRRQTYSRSLTVLLGGINKSRSHSQVYSKHSTQVRFYNQPHRCISLSVLFKSQTSENETLPGLAKTFLAATSDLRLFMVSIHSDEHSHPGPHKFSPRVMSVRLMTRSF